jgi:TRAP-type C4-dicarboxylate transport system permease small subunit
MIRQEQDLFLERVAAILIRCFIMTFALLLIWFCFFVVAGGFVYKAHSLWFDLDWYDLNWFFYIAMAALKMIALVFFLFPYIAIRLVLRKSTAA